jgi:hypothetical protein
MRAPLTHFIHHFKGMENMDTINKVPKNKDFLKYIIYEIGNLYLCINKTEQNQLRTKYENICVEYNITDILQRIVDYCNSYYTSFQLELKME